MIWKLLENLLGKQKIQKQTITIEEEGFVFKYKFTRVGQIVNFATEVICPANNENKILLKTIDIPDFAKTNNVFEDSGTVCYAYSSAGLNIGLSTRLVKLSDTNYKVITSVIGTMSSGNVSYPSNNTSYVIE